MSELLRHHFLEAAGYSSSVVLTRCWENKCLTKYGLCSTMFDSVTPSALYIRLVPIMIRHHISADLPNERLALAMQYAMHTVMHRYKVSMFQDAPPPCIMEARSYVNAFSLVFLASICLAYLDVFRQQSADKEDLTKLSLIIKDQ